jgi:hypothetical protein
MRPLTFPPSDLLGGERSAPGLDWLRETLAVEARRTPPSRSKCEAGARRLHRWHGHAGPSLVVVKTGQITMYAPGKEDSEASVHNAGTTFVHPEGAHNFVNTYVPPAGQPGDTEFYIVYFVPAGASPAAIDVTPAPAGCPA